MQKTVLPERTLDILRANAILLVGPEEGGDMRKCIVMFLLLVALSGCPVTQSQDTPVAAKKLFHADTGRRYWLYVPSYYSEERLWPLVVTLHGTFGWDGDKSQIKEWKHLAEEKGLIVLAPELKSVQGIFPIIRDVWYKDLQDDERAILAIIEQVSAGYRIDPKAVMLTGFSAGGYPMYYVGLRNPKRFDMLIARACNSRQDLFDKIEITDDARELPIMIFYGKDDLRSIQKQSWGAFRFLREQRCFQTQRKEIRGGHLRRPEIAYEIWAERLPQEYRSQ